MVLLKAAKPALPGLIEFRHRLTATLRRLRDDQRGLGAVEFALLFPMLLVVYLTAFELTLGFSSAKRATSAASAIADLVSQQESVDDAFLTSMVDVAAALFVPYDSSELTLKVSGITVSSTESATIAWSWASDNTTPYATGTTADVPEDMLEPDIFLVHAELSVPHELLMYLPNFAGKEIKNITIAREYFYRQRVGDEGITCGDC